MSDDTINDASIATHSDALTEVNDDVKQARGSRGQPIQAGLAREMSEFARELQAESDPLKLLERIAFAAVGDVPNATYAGLSLFTKTGVETRAASDVLVNEVDKAQYAAGEGPCVASSWEHRTTRSDDLEHEPRWPKFAACAVQLGIRSMLSVQLFVEDDAMGALNLYSHEPNAFDDEDENIALILGAHAGVALAASRMRSNFEFALSSRDLIGQAKGILMERYKIGGQRAFEMLVWASQHSHTKLREVALTLTETGEFKVD